MPSFIKKSQLTLLKIMQQGKTTAEVSNLLKKDFVVNFHCQADQTPIIDELKSIKYIFYACNIRAYPIHCSHNEARYGIPSKIK